MNEPRNAADWFEIPVTDLDRARRFYEEAFRIEMSPLETEAFRMALFPTIEGAPGAAGALMEAESYVPSHAGALVYLWSPDIEGTLERVRELGGRILNPKMSVGEHGFVGHFEDCEGNRVGLHSLT